MKKALIFILMSALIFLCSCGREYTCAELLSIMLRISGGTIEGGQLYLFDAEDGEIGYLPQKNADILYGEGAYGTCFALLEDFALFISAHEPEELAVFKCRSTTDCEAVAQMCMRRADSIKIALSGTSYEERSRGIAVEIYGRTVVFYFSEDARRVSSEIKTLL